MFEEIIRITPHDAAYPSLLKEIPDAPQALYLRGNIEALYHNNFLAVVGSRKSTPYGTECIEQLLPAVVQKDITIVSGLAIGIDALAHRVSVQHKKPTIAVLGSGSDDTTIYPSAHLPLAHEIMETGGLLISEYAPGTPPAKFRFPARNRIVAGMSQATILIEAALKSGSLITSRLALEYNREVGAVPGRLNDPTSEGTNDLIRQGAHVITNPQDILDLYGLSAKTSEEQLPLSFSQPQQTLLNHLSHEPQHVSDLMILLQKPISEVTTLLSEMERGGHIQHVGGKKYIKK